MIYSKMVLPKVAIIGSGPAGLMAASVLAKNGCEVHVFEKRKSAARKLLIAGSSGLNVTYDTPIDEFISYFECESNTGRRFLDQSIRQFSSSHWIRFINDLGLETFLGTSRRYFVKDMKGAKLLSAWIKHLTDLKVVFHFGCEIEDFEQVNDAFKIDSKNSSSKEMKELNFDALIFALGGGSYEDDLVRDAKDSGAKMPWSKMFDRHGIEVLPFQASNVGFNIDWPSKFVEECEGLPLKHVNVRTPRGERMGDLVITRYGLEGTPIYAKGTVGEISIDLKPMMSDDEIAKKIKSIKENMSIQRRIKRAGILDRAAQSLFFHCGQKFQNASDDLEKNALLAAKNIKDLRLHLLSPRPIEEAISTRGGISFECLNHNGESLKFKNLYFAGEMLDYDTVTGGFLIQSAVSTGSFVGQSILNQFSKR